MTKAKIYYHDIGDYLNREDKLAIVKKFGSISKMDWTELTPNEHGDWISQRNDAFDSFIPLEPTKKFDLKTQSFFNTNVIGVSTNRDAWVYNFSKETVKSNMQRMIGFYNEQQKSYAIAKQKQIDLKIDDCIDADDTKISWTRALRKDVEKGIQHIFKKDEMKTGLYRPFIKQRLYFGRAFIESPGLSSQLFPNTDVKNLLINITGVGANKPFSVIISDCITNLDAIEKNQSLPLYYYEEKESKQIDAFIDNVSNFVRRDAVSDFILERARKQYNTKDISKEDIFYYVYGFLHSPEYRETFAADLKKMLPRLPLVDDVRDFWAFSKAGRKLAELHLNYETVEPFVGVTIKQTGENYRVEKMRFPKKDKKNCIIYNSQITIENIPAEAYEYVVNGKSAIEWIMERYQISIHKESGIKNDPNDWAAEVGNPRYILDLLLSIINVSVQTVEIVKGLPKMKFE